MFLDASTQLAIPLTTQVLWRAFFQKGHGSRVRGLVEADPWGAYLETDRGLDTAAWAARSAVGSPLWGAPGNAPAGDVEANYTTMGSDDPPRAWAPGAPDRDDSASVASQVRTHPAGAHAPVGMHVAHDAKEALGAGHDPRHEPRGHGTQWYYDARWHFTPPSSDKAYGAPGKGTLEGERSRLQSRVTTSPSAGWTCASARPRTAVATLPS